MSENQQMSFLQHLDELRWRLVRIAIAVISVAVVLWIYQEWVMNHVFLVLKEKEKSSTNPSGIPLSPIPHSFQSNPAACSAA